MAWFELRASERLGPCTSDGCDGQPRYRLESGDIGSDYCAACRMLIEPCDTCGLPVDKQADACHHCG
jgi:hypothetical protein